MVYEHMCPVCGVGQNTPGLCEACAYELSSVHSKDAFLKFLADVDRAEVEGTEEKSYAYKRLSYRRGWVETLPDTGRKGMIKTLFREWIGTYGMFLEAHRKKDREAIRQFYRDMKTILRLLRSKVISLLAED